MTKQQRLARGAARMLAGLLLVSATVPMAEIAQADSPTGRLGQLLMNRSTLYLPSRMALGQGNKFVLKGQPGKKVRLYLSPQPAGLEAPNGDALRVGENHEELDGVIQPNGLVELEVTLPDEASMDGKTLFVDAVVWQAADFSDLEHLELVDATGRRAAQNALALVKPTPRSGSIVLPSMPGVPANVLQQLSTMSSTLGDERKRELIDNGERDSDLLLDRNSFINRNGLSPIK